MTKKQDHIAVFDSGVGGISVLRELIRQMPEERYLYYGDDAHAPYGVRTTREVQQLTMEAAERLFAQGVKALVVACNTATAAAIKQLRSRYPQKIIVGIEPALKLAADHYPAARVGVLATPLTLREEKFANLSHRFPTMEVYPIPLPGLVEIIEEGGSQETLEAFLRPLLMPYTGKLDAAVLGCTHYPFAAAAIKKLWGDRVALLDGAEGTARETHRRLAQAELLGEGPGEITVLSSSGGAAFRNRCMELLKK